MADTNQLSTYAKAINNNNESMSDRFAASVAYINLYVELKEQGKEPVLSSETLGHAISIFTANYKKFVSSQENLTSVASSDYSNYDDPNEMKSEIENTVKNIGYLFISDTKISFNEQDLAILSVDSDDLFDFFNNSIFNSDLMNDNMKLTKKAFEGHIFSG